MFGQQVILFVKYEVFVSAIALDLKGAVCKIGWEMAGTTGATLDSGSCGFESRRFQPLVLGLVARFWDAAVNLVNTR